MYVLIKDIKLGYIWDVCAKQRYDPCSSAALGSRFIAVGGSNGHKVFSSCEVYDLASDQWSTLAGALNNPRAACGCTVVQGRLYAVGGYGEDGKPYASAEVYDEQSGLWKVTLPMSRRCCTGFGTS